MALIQKPTAKSLDESNTSITIKIKDGSRLCIEKDTGKLFKMYCYDGDNSLGVKRLSYVGTVRLDELKSSLSILHGCLGGAVIKTKIGDLHVADYKHASRLRKWLKTF